MATEETKKTEALATMDLKELITQERPAGADEGTLGNEGIGREDILMPRLGLAQKMSPQIDPTSPKRIEGLEFTDLFNSVTLQKHGKGPLHFIVLRRDDPRWIEFNPIDQGGGIKDMNVPKGDARTEFTTAADGTTRVKPVATMFYDFIVLLLNDLQPADPLKNIVALSLKSSAIKAAKHLNFLISQRGQKMLYKGVYKLTTGYDTDKKSGGVYAIYKIDNAGWLPADSAIEKMASEMFEGWKERAVKIDRDEHPDNPDDFNPATYEGAGKTDM